MFRGTRTSASPQKKSPGQTCMPIQAFQTYILKKRPLFVNEKTFKMSWLCRTLFFRYMTGTLLYHAGRINLLLYTPHTCWNFQSLCTVIGQLYSFLVCCMWWLPKPANLAFPSYTWYCTLGTGCRHSRLTAITNLCCCSSFYMNCSTLATTSHVWPFSIFLSTREWLGCILLVFWRLMCHFSMEGSARIMALPPHWLQKHTDLATHDCVHCPQLRHKPRLVNCSYAWIQRLFGITQTLQFLP
jgi:hypothetical protein